MEKTFENDNFGTNRNNGRSIPPLVVSRAKSAGPVGETWLAKLDGMISELEHIWNISVGEALSGGGRTPLSLMPTGRTANNMF